MKKKLGILSIFLLLFCFSTEAVTILESTQSRAQTAFKQHISTQNISSPKACVDVSFQSSSASYAQGQVQRIPLSNSKNPTSSILFALQTTERLLACAFFDYQKSTQNLIIRFRKANLIFPFHYFW